MDSGRSDKKVAPIPVPGTLCTHAGAGQHAVSVTYDQNLLLYDNGLNSLFPLNQPPGEGRTFSSPRKYSLDLVGKIATEVWEFPMNQSVYSPICSSCYEDAPLNYLIDHASGTAFVPVPGGGIAQLLGLDAAGEKIFYYQYPKNLPCITAYNSIPIHLENTKFPTVGPQALNLSTRGLVSVGDNVLIGGFIVTGPGPKKMVLRALGPSLSGF